MSYKRGTILEIYPQWDKLTVKLDQGDGCEIQHLKLSKCIQQEEVVPNSDNLHVMD